MVNNADDLTYLRLAQKFAGLNSVRPTEPQTQSVAPEQLNSIQARIQSAEESIQNQRQPAPPADDTGDRYLNKLLEVTSSNPSPTRSNNLEMFRNVIDDPRFSNISQTPVGMSDTALLKLFPNIKDLIENDPSKERIFLNNLTKLSNSLDIRVSSGHVTQNDTARSLINKSQTADINTKKLVSASFLNMLGNNQGLVDLLAQQGPRVFVADISNANSGGWYSTDKNMVLPMIGTRSGSDQVNLASFSKVACHELGHWIDHADSNLDGFSSLLGSGFRNQQNRILEGISRGTFDHLNDHYERYATTNPQEFFAVMGQFFVSNPFGMKDDMPEMYELFARALNMDINTDTGLVGSYSGAPIDSNPVLASNNPPRPTSTTVDQVSSSRTRSRTSNSSPGRSTSTTPQTPPGTGIRSASRQRIR